MVHSIRKSLGEYGDKLESGEKERIESAIKELEEAMKGNDKSALDAKTQALAQASQKLGEKVYAAQQGQQGGQAGAGAGAEAQPAGEGQKDEGNVVDAEYEEVKDKKSA
jgi:molecular chaperone DnaK